ncbi:MAG: hypothetical protein ACREMY_02775 [bacterium]
MIVGWVVSLALRMDHDAVLLDGLMAPALFMLVYGLVLATPCAGCRYVSQGWTYNGAMPYPDRWAFGAACLGPALHQIARRLRRVTPMP